MPENNLEIWGGIECTINRVKHQYFDQLDQSGHYTRPGDISLFAGLGVKKMRYPILWEHHQPAVNSNINWSRSEAKLLEMRKQGIDIIAGLVHHGSGPEFVQMQEDSYAEGLALYAGQVADKFPWINFYTPVNEPLTTARFCGLYGLWYPHESNNASFCRILVNECKATILAMEAIRRINPDAKLVQTDDLGKVHSTSLLAYQAKFENERRWLSYDLLCGKVDQYHSLWDYLIYNGITETELKYFTSNPCPPDIIGVNYYLTSERYIDERIEDYPVHTHGGNGQHAYADVEAVRVGRINSDGIQKLLTEVWNRYAIPIAVTEVHLHCTREEQMRWLHYIWETGNNLKKSGVPILAITPWALLGSFGWDCLLTQAGGNYEPGVFDIRNGSARPTMLAAMIKSYSQHGDFYHETLNTPGWWHRSCRVTYGEETINSHVRPIGKVLVIEGYHAGLLANICRLRGLHFIEPAESDIDFADNAIWARIIVNEFMEIDRIGGIDLVIALSEYNLHKCLNVGLDLFIDGESGHWEILNNGHLRKQIPDLYPVRHFLAS